MNVLKKQRYALKFVNPHLLFQATSPVHQCSLSPMQRNQNNTNKQERQGRQRRRAPVLKRSTFQGFRQYPGNARPHSLSNSRNNSPNTRFRSFSRSNSRPRFGNFNQPLECYYCWHLGHTTDNCFRHQNRNFPGRQLNQGRRNNFRNSR